MAVQFSCTGWYVANVYTSDGTLAIKSTVSIASTDLKVDRCDSNYENPTDDVIQETLCKSKICECIADVKSSTDAVKQSVDLATNELKTLNQTSKEIKTVLTDFSNEFKTNIDYSVPTIPDTSNLLEQNKPVQQQTPFKDTTIYFKDEGDAETVGKLPAAPNVKDWEGFLPESPMPPETQLKENIEMNKDKQETSENELIKDNQLKPDIFGKELELKPDIFGKDLELKPDLLEKEPVQSIDPIQGKDTMEQTEQFNKDGAMNKTHIYQQTNKFGESGGN